MSIIISILILTLLTSTLFCRLYISYAYKKNLLDIPNQRSSHTKITPRGGGIVFMILWFLSTILTSFFIPISHQLLLVLLCPTCVVMMVGFWDDRYSLSAKHRVIFYFVAAAAGIYFLGGFTHMSITTDIILPLPWIGSCIGILAIVWSTNLFNFMDGIDGIAAVEALFVLGMGSMFLFLAGAPEASLLALLLAASVGGFLVWNKSPAKLFMGDAGSAPLGCVIMLFALLGDQLYHLPFLLWMILYVLFLFDTALTLVRRVLAGEKWYQSHRLHAYQRLHQAGWSHSKIVLGMMGLNTLFACVAFLGFFYQNIIIFLLLLSIFILAMIYRKIEQMCPMFPKKH